MDRWNAMLALAAPGQATELISDEAIFQLVQLNLLCRKPWHLVPILQARHSSSLRSQGICIFSLLQLDAEHPRSASQSCMTSSARTEQATPTHSRVSQEPPTPPV